MHKLFTGTLAAAAGALVLAAAGVAATSTILIKSTGFSPGSLTVNHGDKVVFRNTDKVDHQVVADNGSFASPILHANQSWTTAALNTAGNFRYHDALHPSLAGRVIVKGPPPAVTLALSLPIVDYGTAITLSGVVSSATANESVELDQQPWGQASMSQVAIVKTGVGGAYSFNVTPSIYTTYVARWKTVASSTRRRSGRAEDPPDPGRPGIPEGGRVVTGVALASPSLSPAPVAVRPVGEHRAAHARPAERPPVPAARLPAEGRLAHPGVPHREPGGERPARSAQRHPDHRKEGVKPAPFRPCEPFRA